MDGYAALREQDGEILSAITEETERQRSEAEMIASENFTSPAVMEAMGSPMTNKYAEGLPGKRYYGGCEHVDTAEDLARDRAKELFGADWVNVQPHSGAQANAAVYLQVMEPGDALLGLSLDHGGHLTHGSPANFSGQLYDAHFYGVDESTGRVDMDQVRDKALEARPRMISIGASAYPRDFDYEAFREIADEAGALLWMDMAHTAGLIAAGVLNDPLPFADVVTTTTHKTLRGPRGGMILVGEDGTSPTGHTFRDGRPKSLGQVLDSGVFPGTQGGPLMHVIAAKAVAFREALQPEFRAYAQQVVDNARAMADELLSGGADLVSGGTDNHLVLVDLRNMGITGKVAEEALGRAGVTCNKNMVPGDPESPFVTSGIRLGSPAMTTRGLGTSEFRELSRIILSVLRAPHDADVTARCASRVREICEAFPLY